jgi:adenine-specific DNA methylase
MITQEQPLKCEECGAVIPENDERQFKGQVICEDCYMTVLSPLKVCDPWAAYCAKSFSEKPGSQPDLTPVQSRILQVLKETGGLERQELAERLKLSEEELKRDFATLRHMEKVSAEKRDGRIILSLS